MTPLELLENKIRQNIPFLKEEYEIFQEGAIDFDMITTIALNHVLLYFCATSYTTIIMKDYGEFFASSGLNDGSTIKLDIYWNLKSAYLKDQSEELINFLNELK